MAASKSSSRPSDSGPASSSSRSSTRLPRSFWFVSALLLFLAGSWIAFRQEPCPHVYAHERTNPLYTDWWLRPIEINAPLRLPEVQADFNDVFALKGTDHVWAVGRGDGARALEDVMRGAIAIELKQKVQIAGWLRVVRVLDQAREDSAIRQACRGGKFFSRTVCVLQRKYRSGG